MKDKEIAKQKTIKRFTNLIDGTVKNGIGPGEVINYYESILASAPIPYVKSHSGFEQNFLEEQIQEYENDEIE